MKSRVCRVFLIALALGAASPGPAATLLETDFAHGSDGWDRNGTARLAPVADPRGQVLQLTRGQNSQVGTAWAELRRRVSSFSFIVEARVRFTRSSTNSCPADGFAFAFAPVESDAIGAAGGALGLAGSGWQIRQFLAFEINTWSGQGLGSSAEKASCAAGKNETFAFDVIRPGMTSTEAARRTTRGTPERGGFKIGQVLPPSGMRIVNGGWYRYQWNVAEDGTMSVFVTGLDESNRQFQKVKVLEVKLAWSPLELFDGRWGVAGATGGLNQTVEVARAAIHAPMVDPL